MDVYKHAKSIVNKLARAGHIAYFAGGWVRDYVMGHPSQDIDIATSATPIEIMDLFPNTILVGLAFGVIIIPIEGHQFEVATFRKDLPYVDGRRPTGITHSSPQEDAYRRDFTINGMFYDPIEEVIHDYVHGREDIAKQIIRTIGNPQDRFFEDRLRMIRAFRFAARFGFTIEAETQEAIRENADKLFPSVAMERIWQEFTKMSYYPRFDHALVEMKRLFILDIIFPELEGMHLNDIKHQVSRFKYYPPTHPVILYIMELFPNLSLQEKIDIARRLKASNRDTSLLEFFDSLTSEMEKGPDLWRWAHFYAHPDCLTCLQVLAARLDDKARIRFLDMHQKQMSFLENHIKRIQNNKPLVTASHLMKLGIKPGKKMGALLKEAEKMAINENLENENEIIEKLKPLDL